MKEFFSFMMGAMFGAGVMLGASELSKNKEVIKKKVNNLIDDTQYKKIKNKIENEYAKRNKLNNSNYGFA